MKRKMRATALLLAVAMVVSLFGASSLAFADTLGVDVIYINGNILTDGGVTSKATIIATQGDIIVYVGDDMNEVVGLITDTDGVRVIDLRGKTVVGRSEQMNVGDGVLEEGNIVAGPLSVGMPADFFVLAADFSQIDELGDNDVIAGVLGGEIEFGNLEEIVLPPLTDEDEDEDVEDAEEAEENEIVPITAALPEVEVVLDGETLTFEVAPQINPETGRVIVPLRAIFEAKGALVDWDEETATATATKGDIVVVITIGDDKPTINGEEVEIDQPAIIVNDRTLAPLRFVAEAFGGEVEWDEDSYTAYITTLTDEREEQEEQEE